MTFEDFGSAWDDFSQPGWMECDCPPPSSLVSQNIHKYQFSMIAHSVDSVSRMKEIVVQASELGFGYVYVTDDTLPNPYDQLPRFFFFEN